MGSHLHNVIVRREFYDFISFVEWIQLTQLCKCIKPLLQRVTRPDTHFLSCQLEDLNDRIDWIKTHWPLLALGFSAGKELNEQLSDVSIFARLDRVELTRCHHVSDLSPLKGIYSVRLNTCSQIHDLSPLRQTKIISLETCHSVSDISCLEAVEELNIYRCFQATDISGLSNLRRLTMEANNAFATSLRGTDTVERLESITLINVGIECLDDLRTVKNIAIYNSNRSEVNVLRTAHKLTMHTARLGRCFARDLMIRLMPFASGCVGSWSD